MPSRIRLNAALRLGLPGMGAMLASSLCALLDALLLGKSSAPQAAAVSACLPVLMVIQTIGFTLGTGAGSHVSRSLGGGNKASAAQAAQAALRLSLLASIPLCAAGLLWRMPLVRLLGTNGDAAGHAAAYALYVMISGPLLCMNLVLSSLLRGVGRMNAYLAAYVSGAALGAALQFALIGRMGVSGSGIAMLARESLTLSILIFHARRGESFLLPRMRRVPRSAFSDIMRSGLPVLVRQGLTGISAALSARTAARFGEAALAGTGLAARAVMLVTSAAIGFSQGFQPIIGRAAGQGDMENARKSGRLLLAYVLISLLVTGAAVFLLAPRLLAPFKPEAAVMGIAVQALRAQSAVFFAQGAVVAMTTLTQALGMTVRGSLVAASRQGFILIPLLLVLPRLFGLTGLILSPAASDVLSLILCLMITAPALRCSSCAPCGCSDAQKASR